MINATRITENIINFKNMTINIYTGGLMFNTYIPVRAGRSQIGTLILPV